MIISVVVIFRKDLTDLADLPDLPVVMIGNDELK